MAWDKGRPKRTPEQAEKYGSTHQKLRRQYVARLRDGDPCAQCKYRGKPHHPMYRSQIPKLHLCHNDAGTKIIGLGHAKCNLEDGAVRGKQRQNLAVRYSQMW